jgi:hypothetical protein
MLRGESHSRRQAPESQDLIVVLPNRCVASPCEGCRHHDRCKAQSLACASLELFENAGRFSAYAPRQPTAAIFQRIHVPHPPRPSAEERRRAREALAVTLQRESSEV